MSSYSVQNSFIAKIKNFFRGVIVFLFLCSIPFAAFYWDQMPPGVKAGFQWLHAKVRHSDAPAIDPDDVIPAPESILESQNARIFPEIEYNQEFLARNTVSVFPIQQVSHNQPRQTVIQDSEIQNSEILDLEYEMQLLGASHCRLEPWGKEGRLFRFSCFAVPFPGHDGFQKHFQQIASTPEMAMKKVRDQILDWQSGETQR